MIDASNVVLNLDGFQIACAGGQGTAIYSDSVTSGYANLTWMGIDLEYTSFATVEAVTVSNYGVRGVQIANGAIRKNSVTGGSDPQSIGFSLSSGLVDSNFEMGDYLGISIYGGGKALVVGNVVLANYAALLVPPGTRVSAGSNTLQNPGSAARLSGGVSHNNNLCNSLAC